MPSAVTLDNVTKLLGDAAGTLKRVHLELSGKAEESVLDYTITKHVMVKHS